MLKIRALLVGILLLASTPTSFAERGDEDWTWVLGEFADADLQGEYAPFARRSSTSHSATMFSVAMFRRLVLP